MSLSVVALARIWEYQQVLTAHKKIDEATDTLNEVVEDAEQALWALDIDPAMASLYPFTEEELEMLRGDE